MTAPVSATGPPSSWDLSEVDPRVGPDEHGRYRFNVAVVKIPHADRTVARAVMPDAASARERQFFSVHGADTDDDDLTHPVGADAEYVLRLTLDEADTFHAVGEQPDGNLRWLELDRVLELPPVRDPLFPLIDAPAGGGLVGGLSLSTPVVERGEG